MICFILFFEQTDNKLLKPRTFVLVNVSGFSIENLTPACAARLKTISGLWSLNILSII